MRIVRTCATMSAIVLAAASTAIRAESFDLDCMLLDKNDKIILSSNPVHYQIDLSQRNWCVDQCREIFPVIENSDSIILKSESGTYADHEWLVFHIETGILEDGYEMKGKSYTSRRFHCDMREFGGLGPYLVEPARPRNMIKLLEMFQDESPLEGMDYPKINGTASVGVEVAVDKNGNGLSCKVIEPSGHAEVDDYPCRLIMASGTKYFPAKDIAGNPVDGRYSTRVVFAGSK